MSQCKKVVVVGGGSSGWMTAAYLNGALNDQGKTANVEITLIESPDIPRISVGEATVPSIRHLLAVVGINEKDFMIATDATFKQSIKYTNWVHNNNTFYHHPFSRYQIQPLDQLAVRWHKSDRKIPFMETCSAQPIICEMGRAPLMLGKWDMGPPLSYAFHMNAQKFADYLRDFSTARGVKHVLANVTDIDMTDGDNIKTVHTDQEHQIPGDLFVDCTGFRSMLIEKKLDVPFNDCSQFLLCDRAVTMHVPYEDFYPGQIRPYTTATALSNGWIWDIPMKSQRSIGYVHSSSFIDDDSAEKEMRNYQGGKTDSLNSRIVKFKVGCRDQAWKGNCIAIGLSNSFIEPLESTGLYLSDLGAVMLAELFPHKLEHMDKLAFRYNRILSNRFYEVLDFINMHYCLTKRQDSEFWKAVQRKEHINDRLQAKLEFWKIKPPSASDFEDQFFMGQTSSAHNSELIDNRANVDTASLWNHESYQCILYGMEFMLEEVEAEFGTERPPAQVHPQVIQRLQAANSKLPPHHIWLKQIVGMNEYKGKVIPKGWV